MEELYHYYNTNKVIYLQIVSVVIYIFNSALAFLELGFSYWFFFFQDLELALWCFSLFFSSFFKKYISEQGAGW